MIFVLSLLVGTCWSFEQNVVIDGEEVPVIFPGKHYLLNPGLQIRQDIISPDKFKFDNIITKSEINKVDFEDSFEDESTPPADFELGEEAGPDLDPFLSNAEIMSSKSVPVDI
jgi:hypothetical protein